ncbi:hypothetical protein GF345_02485 [Candidatus Woesearchaeota archaeon]|nr:hypothetical protein [Candidatus Woesearchaeota archaeon]
MSQKRAKHASGFAVELKESLLDSGRISFLAKSALSDLSFFVLFSIAFTWFFQKIAPLIEQINLLMSQLGGSMPSDYSMPDKESFGEIVAQYQQVTDLAHALFYYLAILIAVTFLLWCVFQGTSWWIAHRKLKHEVSWLQFIKRFSAASLVYALLTAVILLIIAQISRITSFGGIGLIDTRTLFYAGAIALIALSYFAVYTFAVLDEGFRKMLRALRKTAVSSWKKSLPPFIAVLIILGVFYIVMKAIAYSGTDVFYTVLAGLIIFLPMAAWIRVYMCRTVNNIK